MIGKKGSMDKSDILVKKLDSNIKLILRFVIHMQRTELLQLSCNLAAR